MNAPAINTHHLVIPCGKHAGQPYTRLPVSYLRWMVSASHEFAPIAQAELDRRGTVNPSLDVSGHAIDRLSMSPGLELWKTTRKPDEGISAWLNRIAAESLHVEPLSPGRYSWGPLVLCFDLDLAWPVLKTVIYNPRAAGAGHSADHEGTPI